MRWNDGFGFNCGVEYLSQDRHSVLDTESSKILVRVAGHINESANWSFLRQ